MCGRRRDRGNTDRVVKELDEVRLNSGETLTQRVVRGGIWVFALRITNRLFQLIRTIVLAQVLAPSDFGLMGIALLAMSTFETFSQTGFNAALIQKKGDIEDYLDTAWTVSALRGGILFAVLYPAAPYIALFFDTPIATPVIRVIGISMLLSGLTNIGVVYFQKELEFNKQFVYQLSGTVADLVVSITAVLLLRSVWALVFGLLAGKLVGMASSYFMHPYRPRLRLEGVRVRELFGFGKWISGSSILVFLLTQGDDIFLGKTLGATALGLYQMAYRISNLPATEISHTVSQVTLPAYSKLQDRLVQVRQAYLKTLQATAFSTFPLAGAIVFFAPSFTYILLGERWLPIILPIQILSIYGLSRSLVSNTGSLFQAIGRPEVTTKLQLIKLILLGLVIYPLTRYWGIPGTAMAVAVSGVLVDIFVFYMVHRVIRCYLGDLIRSVLVPGVVTAITFLFLRTTEMVILIEIIDVSSLMLFVLFGAILYILLAFIGAKVGNIGIVFAGYTRIWHGMTLPFRHESRKDLVALLERLGGPGLVNFLKKVRDLLWRVKCAGQTLWGKIVWNRVNLRRNKGKVERYLEIGSGNERIPGFETLNIIGGPNVDYVFDAAKPLPFEDNTFEVIYASHVLEHIPWYKTEEVLKQWVRILKSGGRLEVWVPDGLKICKVLIEAENGSARTLPDDWSVLNPRKDPFVWVNGRLMYGTRSDYPSSHRAIFTPRYLMQLFERVGLMNVSEMDRIEVRGSDHGWINLGVKGTKP